MDTASDSLLRSILFPSHIALSLVGVFSSYLASFKEKKPQLQCLENCLQDKQRKLEMTNNYLIDNY